MPVCAAVGCTRRTGSGQQHGHRFYSFPLQNPDLLNKWLAKMKRKGFVPTKSSQLSVADPGVGGGGGRGDHIPPPPLNLSWYWKPMQSVRDRDRSPPLWNVDDVTRTMSKGGGLVNVQEWGCFTIFWRAGDVTQTMSKLHTPPPLSGNPISAPGCVRDTFWIPVSRRTCMQSTSVWEVPQRRAHVTSRIAALADNMAAS